MDKKGKEQKGNLRQGFGDQARSKNRDGFLNRLWQAIAEHQRLKELSDKELVNECLHCEATDHPIVEEMMSRLDPQWNECESKDLS